MDDPAADPIDPDDLPDAVREQLDTLDIPELRAARAYVEDRIESLRQPIEAEIVENAVGEVVDVEDHGTHAIVRTHPPDPGGSGVDTGLVSLYHVRRERHVNGEEVLHWSFLGDIQDSTGDRCDNCGRRLEGDADVCPFCDDETTETTDTED